MLDWLEGAWTQDSGVTLGMLTLRLTLAAVLGAVVAGIYLAALRKPRQEAMPLVTTLVLLTILIAMVTLVIGSNVARAFSLVGALSIVRFRTVVEDTRDTAFVIFAVVVGMGIGSGDLLVALAGIPIVTAAALLLRLWGNAPSTDVGEFTIAIRLGIGRDPESLFQQTFAKHLASFHLRSMATARQGAALDLTYAIRLRSSESPVAFVHELNQLDGVQSVELRQM